MILYTQSQSIVAFGVEQFGDYFIAELVLYMEGLRDKATMYELKSNERHTLFVPTEIRGSMLPGMALDVTFIRK